MTQELVKLGFKRKPGMFYYLNQKGNLVEMNPITSYKKEVAQLKIKKAKGYFYFLNK